MGGFVKGRTYRKGGKDKPFSEEGSEGNLYTDSTNKANPLKDDSRTEGADLSR